MNSTDPKTTLLRNARIVLPDRVAERAILIADGRITRIFDLRADESVQTDADLNIDGLTLFPGFIDVHIHGAVGVDTLTATADDLHKVARTAREVIVGQLRLIKHAQRLIALASSIK